MWTQSQHSHNKATFVRVLSSKLCLIITRLHPEWFEAHSDSESWHAYLHVTCSNISSIFFSFLSCHVLHTWLIQTLNISFQTQLAFSPSKYHRHWHFSPSPSILCEHFLVHSLIKIITGVTEKGVLIIYKRKHIKGSFSRPIRRQLKSLPFAMELSGLQRAFYSFLCKKFFNYILTETFTTAELLLLVFTLCQTLHCGACK